MRRNISISVTPSRTEALIECLAELWRRSTASTHSFLSEEMLEQLRPEVVEGFRSVERLVVAFEGVDASEPPGNDAQPIGFAGIDGDKIEMLFVAPEWFGCGVGSALMRTAIEQFGVRRVDVNEQNPAAAAFYRRRGFEVFNRSEHDGRGRPFPILELELK